LNETVPLALRFTDDFPIGLDSLLHAGLPSRRITDLSLDTCRFTGSARGIVLRTPVISRLADFSLARRRSAICALTMLSHEDPISCLENLHPRAVSFPAFLTRRLGFDIYLAPAGTPYLPGDIVINNIAIVGDDPDRDPDSDGLDLPILPSGTAESCRIGHGLSRCTAMWLIGTGARGARVLPADSVECALRLEYARWLPLLLERMFDDAECSLEKDLARYGYACEILARDLRARDYRCLAGLGGQLPLLRARFVEGSAHGGRNALRIDRLLQPVLLRAITRELELDNNLLCLDLSVFVDGGSLLRAKAVAHYIRDNDGVVRSLDIAIDPLLRSEISGAGRTVSIVMGARERRSERACFDSSASARLIAFLRRVKE
jgi:hypothetical protein